MLKMYGLINLFQVENNENFNADYVNKIVLKITNFKP